MDIIMLRHGESFDNLNKVYSREWTRLTPKGIKQIKHIKKELEYLSFEKIYCSPHTRTLETMKILGLSGLMEARIQEIDFGIFQGKTFNEISARHERETKKWTDDINGYVIPQGESLEMVYKRLVEFLEQLEYRGQSCLLISHDSIIRLAFCWVFDNLDLFYRFRVDNGSINIISIHESFKYISKINHY